MLCLAATPSGASAQQPPAQPSVQATCPYVLKAGIPFAWLRFEASSFAGFGVTLRPGETVTLNNPAILAWDGTQWWVYVWPNAAPNVHGYYWVELNSIEPRCQPATPTPAPGAASWSPGTVVRVRLNVPFVWFRAAPAPGNPPIHTVLPGTQLVIVQGASMDFYNQWWWLMSDPRNGITGWVEQNTVELVSSSTQPVLPADWRVGDTVRVRPTVPFSWLRYAPNSLANVVYTAWPRQEVVLQQGPQFDNVQNWWNVRIPGISVSGWVEENSLEFVRRVS
jgi:hypothetical protein